MSSHTERLERVAAEERERLGEHLNQLQQRLERALDPAAVYDRHPLPLLAAALVGGVVLGAVTRSDGPAHRRALHDDDHYSLRGGRSHGGLLSEGIAQLRGALMGMLFARLAETVQDIIGGSHDRVPAPRKRSAARPVAPAMAAEPDATS